MTMKKYQGMTNTRTRALVFGLSLMGLAFGAGTASAEGLDEALALAYQNNPDLEAQRAALRATDENVPQAKSGYRPTVQGTGSISKSDQTSFFTTENSLTPRQMAITLTQPVFSGFTTVNNIRQAKREVMAGRADLVSAEQDVLLQAVTAYVDVVRDEAVLDLNNNQVEVLRRQLDASTNRFEVGEITRTDVAQSEARLAASLSGQIAAEAQLTASRTAYLRLMGQLPGSLDKAPTLPALPINEDEAMAVAGENNPTLIAAMYREEAARYSVNSAAGELLPTVKLQAQYSKGVETFAPGSETESKQITAQLTVPFYQGGASYSRVRQAKQIRSQRKLQIVGARRQVEEQVRNAWIQLRAAKATINASQSQVNASDIALEGVRQEADVGARTTLDVLNAEQESLDAQVELVRAERNQYVAAYALLSAVGQLTARDLGLPVNHYNPTDHYDDVSNQWLGWGVD